MQKHARHLRSVHYDLNDDLAQIKSAFADATEDVRDKTGKMLHHSYSNLRATSSDLQKFLSDYVAEKPLKSLGIAVLSGIVLGFLFRR